MLSLPTELLFNMADRLPSYAVDSFSQTCTVFHAIFSDNNYWKHRFQKDFNQMLPFNVDWKRFYRGKIIHSCDNAMQLYLKTHFLDLVLSNKEIYYYNQQATLWRKISHLQFIVNCLSAIATQYHVQSICDQMFTYGFFRDVKAFLPCIEIDPSSEWIAIQNQEVISIKTGAVRIRVREDFKSLEYPVVYNPDASIQEWLQDTVGKEQTQLKDVLYKLIFTSEQGHLHLEGPGGDQLAHLINTTFLRQVVTYGPSEFQARWNISLCETSMPLALTAYNQSALLNFLLQ